MYIISQFKPTLYLLLLLGMAGFAIAMQSPAVGLLGCGGIALNAWLVRTGRFRPMPRLVANVVTILATGYVTREFMAGAGNTSVLIIGQFLVMLQLVKVWEHRANRDLGQLIVLSLLLMVAASINTSSLLFGLMLVVYLFLSLYCCLLFHLKVETDSAEQAFALPADKANPAALKQDQRFLSSSMRRLTVVVSGAAISMAVIVFLFFPRGSGQNFLAPPQFRSSQALVGFSDEVNLDQVARITQNDAVVAYAEVWHNDKRVSGGDVLLRGTTFDSYTRGDSEHPSQWARGASPGRLYNLTRDSAQEFARANPPDRWRQRIKLEPTGSKVLFAVPGIYEFTAGRDLRLNLGSDDALMTEEPLRQAIEYEAVSSGAADASDMALFSREHLVDERIKAYARRPDVSGSDARGSLAQQRSAGGLNTLLGRPSPLDGEIAANIEQHFKGPGFGYTLDITDAKNRRGQDPIVWFLSQDGRRGHCEYFAGAMALLCQGLGLNARMVVGFKSDEYNAVGGYFIVRQAHAHAWVEVLTTEGWKTFDPTSGRDTELAPHSNGLWQKVKHLFNFLEFTYANNVIAYDNENRENLIQSVEQKMTTPFYRSVNSGRWPRDLMSMRGMGALANSIFAGVLGVVTFAAALFLIWYVWRRLRLRRRAARIGIESLPPAEQLRLAEQLGFYDDLLQLLDRHAIRRPAHLTPMEFSRSLLFLPSDIYEQVGRLTGVFYRVRYGRAHLNPGLQRRLANVIARIDHALAGAQVVG